MKRPVDRRGSAFLFFNSADGLLRELTARLKRPEIERTFLDGRLSACPPVVVAAPVAIDFWQLVSRDRERLKVTCRNQQTGLVGDRLSPDDLGHMTFVMGKRISVLTAVSR